MTTKGEGQGWASASAWAGRALEAWGRAVEGDGDVVKAGDDLAAAVRAMSLAHGGLAEAGAGALEQELVVQADEVEGEPRPGDKIVGVGWFTAEELARLTMAPADDAERAALMQSVLAQATLAGGSGRCDECDGEGHVEVDTCALCESSIRATCPKCKGVPR